MKADEVSKGDAQRRRFAGRCLGLLASGLLGACSAADGAGVEEAPLESTTWMTAAEGTTGSAAQLDGVVWISRAPDPRTGCGVGGHFEDQPFTVSGRVTFSPAGQDSEVELGVAQVSEGVEIRRHTLTTLDCLRSVGESCSSADFGNAREGRCVSHDGLCECDVASFGSAGVYGWSWSYEGPGVVNLNDEPHRYCVDGDELRLERTDGEGGTTYLNIYQRVAN